MAWNISKAKRQALVKLQLRDKNGKFIEMGGGVKWYSSRLRKVVSGTVVGTKGENALIRLNKENDTHEPALVSVPARSIEPIDAKATLPGKGEPKSNLDTPEFEKPESVGKSKGDDEEVDGDTESDHEKSVSEVSAAEMRAMPKGTVIRSFKTESAGFIKADDGDNWQHILSNGTPSGSNSTSAAIKNHDGFYNHVFSPEGTPPVTFMGGGNGNDDPTNTAPSKMEDNDSAENYAITETSDGNTYISKKDGAELYFPARELKVGDEVIAPAGADPTKPFSIGRNWATKGAERLNSDGPVIGKVIAMEGERYAVVQMAGGHTIPDRRNPDEATDTVTIGLSNRVIKATPGLKEALGDKLGDNSYGDRPSDEDQEITDNDPQAQSDHVGREATPEQIAEEEAQNGATPEEAEAPEAEAPEAIDPATAKIVLSHRITGAAKDELEFGIETMESDGVDPGLRMAGSKAEVYDVDAAIFTVDGPLGVLDDNLMGDVYKGSHKAIAKAKQRGLKRFMDVLKGNKRGSDKTAPEAPAEEKKISDVSIEEMSKMPTGTVLRDPDGKLAYFTKAAGDKWSHHRSNGDASGTESTSAAVKSSGSFDNHTFAKPGTDPNAEYNAKQQATPEAVAAPESAPETAPAPEATPAPESPVEDAPEAPEEAPEVPEEVAPEPAATPPMPERQPQSAQQPRASTPAQIKEAVAEIEQDTEDIDSSGITGEDLDAALEEAVRDITGSNGEGYTIVPIRDSENQWNYGLADENGTEVANFPVSEYDSTAEIASEIIDTVNTKAPKPAAEKAPKPAEATEAKKEAPKPKEPAAKPAETSPAPAEKAEKAPVSAPKPEVAPESAPEAEAPAADVPAPLDVDVTPNRAMPGSIRVASNKNKKILSGVASLRPGDKVLPIGDKDRPYGTHGNYSNKSAFVRTNLEAGTGTVVSQHGGFAKVLGSDGKHYYPTHHFVALKSTPELESEIAAVNDRWNAESGQPTPATPEASAPKTESPEAPETGFLNGYDIDADSGLGRVQKDKDGNDYVLENTTGDLISALPVGSTLTTLDETKMDAFLPHVKLDDNVWGRENGAGDRGFKTFTDSQMMETGVEQGVKLPSNGNIEFTPADVDRAKESIASSKAADESYRQGLTERAERNAAPATPSATPEATPQEPLVDGTQDELKIPGVRKQLKRDDKSKQHVKALDKLEAGDKVSHTNARGEKSTYLKHADGTWDEIDPNDEFPEDSPIREAIPASEIADIHKRGDLKVTKEGEEEEADAPSDAPAPATASEPAATPETTPEVAPEPDAAPEVAEEAPSEVLYSRILAPDLRREAGNAASAEDSGFTVTNGNLEVTDLEKARDAFRKIADDFSTPSANRSANISRNRIMREARSMLVRMNEAIADRDSNEFAKPVREDQKFDGSGLKAKQKLDKAPEAGQEPSDVQAPEFDDEPEEQEEVAPISDEQAGRVLEALTAENPLPEGIERHVPEAVEGEDYAPTQQQQDVIDAVLGRLNTLVQAKAGAGKTSTLRAIARRLKLTRPDAKIGYIAFNKSVQLEADGSMPDNTEARTGHSVAVAWAPDWMNARTKVVEGNISKPSEIAAHLGIDTNLDNNGRSFSTNSQAMAVKRTLDTYANTAEEDISADHLPDSVKKMPESVQNAIIDHANAAWSDMRDRRGKLRLSLDHIRKQWALSRPDFSKDGSGLSTPIDVLFLDEAQDTPPVLAKVIADQTVQKVIVGDADQAIYAFTGATDYLSEAEGDVELPLNKSWRFGPAVADMGNRFLQLVESDQRVVGGGKSTIVEGMTDADAVLVRSNGGMLGEVAKELEAGRKVGVPDKTKEDLQSLINTAHYIQGTRGRPAKGLHEDLANFRTWGEFLDEVEKGDDQNLTKIARMISTIGLDRMEELLSKVVEVGKPGFNAVNFTDHRGGLIADGDTFPVKDFMKIAGFRYMEAPDGRIETSGRFTGQKAKRWVATGTPAERERKLAKARELAAAAEDVDVVVSTAHKSKGLEWDRVRIGDDFWAPKVDPDTGDVEMVKPEELRLNYVAVTRAAKELDLGSLAWVLDHTDPNGGEVSAPEYSQPEAPSLQSEDESVDKKSPVKQSFDEAEPEVAPEEAPVVDSPEAVEEAPVVEEPAEPEVPSYNESGLSDTEQATLDYAEGRLGRAQSGRGTANIDDLEREINNIREHGERRNAGETLGEYTPGDVSDDAVEVPDTEVDPEVAPMGRRTRRNYDGVILNDENGNSLAYGDIVGHRTRGPVQITSMVSSTGRIGFKVLKTGKTGTVEAHLVTHISSGGGDVMPDTAAPSATAFDYPTTSGEIYVDPTTGKKAYIDADGNRVSVGDRVVETRTGKAGKVRAVYATGAGKAWPRIDFDNGEDRRVTYTKVFKEGVEAPEVAPTPAPEVAPAPEVTPEVAPAPEVAPIPEATPEVAPTPKVVPESPESGATSTNLTSSVSERAEALRNAPTGSKLTSANTVRTYTKRGPDEWYANTGVTTVPWTDDELVSITDPSTVRGVATLTKPAASDVPDVVSGTIEPNTVPSGSYSQRKRDFIAAPLGTVVSNLGHPDEYWVKVGNDDWSALDGRVKSNYDIAARSSASQGMWRINPDGSESAPQETPAGDAPEAAPVTGISVVGEHEARLSLISGMPVGTTFQHANSAQKFTKRGENNWTNDRTGNLSYSDDELAASTRPDSVQGIATLIPPADYVAPAPAAPASPQHVVGELMPRSDDERYALIKSAPAGTVMDHPNGLRYEKAPDGMWNEIGGSNSFNNEMMSMLSFPATGQWIWGTPEGASTTPATPDANAPYTLPSDGGDRLRALRELPLDSIVEVDGVSFTKDGPDRFISSSLTGNTYTAWNVQAQGSSRRPGRVIPAPVSTQDVSVPHTLSASRAERRNSLESAPVGSVLTGTNGRTYLKRDSGWQDSIYGTDHSTADMLSATEPTPTATFSMNPDSSAADSFGIHTGLPKGTFLPHAEGSKTGLKKVADNKWEFVREGVGTGRFQTDEGAQIQMDMSGLAPQAPKPSRTDYGTVDYGVSDLGFPNGENFGEWLKTHNPNELPEPQKRIIRNAWRKFATHLNENLPAGYEVKPAGTVSFNSDYMSHTFYFFKDGVQIGKATRDINGSWTDPRTGDTLSHVHHSWFKIEDQGNGVSPVFLKASSQLYRQLGLDRISINAALSIGGYAWARAGFDFQDAGAMSYAVNSMWGGTRIQKRRVDGVNGAPARYEPYPWSGMSQGEFDAGMAEFEALKARATEANYMNGTHPRPVDFANIGRPSGPTTRDQEWFGKTMLKGSSWNGEFVLNDDEAPNPFAPNSGPVTEVAQSAPSAV